MTTTQNAIRPGNRCAHRSCRTTQPCRYGNPNAQEPVHPDPHTAR